MRSPLGANSAPPLFALKHMTKDARLAAELAKELGQKAPIGVATRDTYGEAEAQGLGDVNWTGVHGSQVKASCANASVKEGGKEEPSEVKEGSQPWSTVESMEEYARLYAPTCADHVFENHFVAFGEQNLEKIMLDYTEESVISVWNWASQALEHKKGRAEISDMFSGFWKGMAPDGWAVMEA